MGILLDTSLLIAHERGQLDLELLGEEWLAHRGGDPCAISVVTVRELPHGSARARTRVQRARHSAFVGGLIDAFPALSIDLPTARLHAEPEAGLAEAGMHIDTHDLCIAASAVARGLSLVTLNARGFDRTPGVQFEVWR